jgi:predicted permease
MTPGFRIDGVRRLFRLRGPGVIARDVDDELRFHLESRVEELVRRGTPPGEARAIAEREFGDLTLARNQLTSLDRRIESRSRRVEWRDAIVHDLRDAYRSLRHSPGFVAAVVVTIAVGVGATASMFSIVDRLLFQPPQHVQNADRISRVYFTQTFSWGGEITQDAAGFEQYDGVRAAKSADAVAAFYNTTASIGRGLNAQEIKKSGVTASFFPLLGVHPQLGRFFADDDDLPPRGQDVVVISDGLWRREFGAAADVRERSLLIGAHTYRVIGVAPRGFTGIDLDRVDLWVPLSTAGSENLGPDWREPGVATWLRVLVRRAPDMPLARVNAELTVIFKRIREDLERKYNSKHDPTARAAAGPLTAARALDEAKGHASEVRSGRIARWLFGMSVFVLIIACANVANLTLARALGRRREIAVRIALGISRARLIRQLTAEGLLLATMGTIGGAALAATAGAALRRLLVPTVDWDAQQAIDARLFGFLVIAIGLVTLLTAIYPARQVSNPSSLEELRQGARDGGLRKSRLRAGLLVAQAALAAMLLVGSGLFVKSLRNVVSVPLGFDAPHTLVIDYSTTGLGIPAARRIEMFEQAREAALRVPGVSHASLALTAPFWSSLSGRLVVPGLDSVPTPKDGGPYMNAVTPDFFTTVGTRIVRGRAFTESDGFGAPRVVIIGANMARKIWKSDDPIGRCVKVGRDTMPCSTVIGIAEDAHRYALDDESFQFYVPLAQKQTTASLRTLLVRTPGDPALVISALRKQLASFAPGLPYVGIRSLESLVEPQRQAWRLGAVVFTIFGAVAMVIATLGLYAMIAYEVARRRHEFGIRMALGAVRGHVVGLVMRDGVVLVGAGLALGCGAALAASSHVQSMLYGVSARDPVVFIGVGGVLLITALIACAVPSLKAARISPVTALQAE